MYDFSLLFSWAQYLWFLRSSPFVNITGEHQGWAPPLLLLKCCGTLYASRKPFHIQVTYYNVLPWCLFCYLLVNFVKHLLQFPIRTFFYKFTFLSVYSVKEIPKKHLRRPFVACNSIIYWPHLSNKYFYLLIWMSILPLIEDLCCCYKLLMSTSFIKSFSPFRWFALSTDGWQENCKLTSAGIQNAQTSARRW